MSYSVLHTKRAVFAAGPGVVGTGSICGIVLASGTRSSSGAVRAALGREVDGVDARVLESLVGMAGASALARALASYLPARRAASGDPVIALRSE